jgi:dTDP-glucose pyrophosphorylase
VNRERFEEILVGPHSTVREVIRAIDAGKAHLALVVDADRRLLGTITDGDIRRALLAGIDLDGPAEPIVHRSPVTANPEVGEADVRALMTQHRIDQVPVIADERVIDVVLLRELVTDRGENHVVIFAGGEGQRLRPLTENVPKPMLEVGGRPLLETVLEQVRDAGFSKAFLLVNYRSEEIERHFGGGEGVGLDLRYVHEPAPLGSAGGLSLVREELDRPFVVLNADLLTNVDVRALLNFHQSEENVITVGVKQFVLEVPYGVVELDETRVLAVREKPELRFFVNAGIYALDPEATAFLPEAESEFHMTHLIERALVEGARVGSFPVHEYWLDIGQMSDYERANDDHVTRLFVPR